MQIIYPFGLEKRVHFLGFAQIKLREIGFLFSALIVLNVPAAFAQPDTLIEYDVRNKRIEIIPPVGYNITEDSNSTSCSIGFMGSSSLMDINSPNQNLHPNTTFTSIARAAKFFDVSTYPARTSVKLFGWLNDSLVHNCSGTMVSENIVLTAAHCILNQSEKWLFDSVLAVPAFDNGVFLNENLSSMVEKYYIFKNTFDNGLREDIALLKLRNPLGFDVGWQGIAYNNDTSFFEENIFHKFSYPISSTFTNIDREFNGDTMYYQYGMIDFFSTRAIGVLNGHGLGASGMSGSSLFYSNNEYFHSYGVLNTGVNFMHFLIDQNIFYQFKNIIENRSVYVNPETNKKHPVFVFPNPSADRVCVDLYNPDNQNLTFELYNVQGQKLRTLENISGSRYFLDRAGLPSGSYLLRVHHNSRVYETKRVVFY